MAPLTNSTAPVPPQAGQPPIQHFTHQHPLYKLFKASEFNCDGCKTRGRDLRYRCSTCDFDLHESCAAAPHRLSSHLHPHHQILLVNRQGTSHFCDVCKGFTGGLSYTCQTCEFDVHLHCTQTPVATGVPKLTLNPCHSPTVFGGGHGVNQNQPAVMIINNQQQQQGIPTPMFINYPGAINCKPVMIINNQQQQQGIPTTAIGGYPGMNNNQAMMMNNHHHQQQGIPMTAYGGCQNQFGGYQNQQPVMINQQQKQKEKSNTLSNVGIFAANVLTTSLIGVPIFSSKK